MNQQHSNNPDPAVKPHLVLDTNVILEIYSLHDIEGLGASSDQKNLAYRRERARDALLFGYFCHMLGLTTASLKTEAYQRLVENVPPKDDGPWQVAYTTRFAWYVRKRALWRWRPRVFAAVDDGGMSGAARDDAYVQAARSYECFLLVTNEGNGPMGPRPTDDRGRPNLRGRAEAAGVTAQTPGECWRAQGLRDGLACEGFLSELDAQWEWYRRHHAVACRDWAKLRAAFSYVLFAPDG